MVPVARFLSGVVGVGRDLEQIIISNCSILAAMAGR